MRNRICVRLRPGWTPSRRRSSRSSATDPRRRPGPSRSARASSTTGRRPRRSTPSATALGRPGDARVRRRRGPAAAGRRESRASCRTRTASTSAAAAAIMVTAGANMAFMHAVLAMTHARRRSHPAGAVLLQSRDGDRDGRLPRRSACRPTTRYQLALDAIARAITAATRAIVTDLAEQSERRGAERGVAARSERRSAASAGCITSADETVRVLHLRRRRATCRRGRSRAPPATRSRCTRCRRPTASPGWRIGYMVYPGAPGVGDDEEPGHDPDLPDDCVAGRRRWRRSTSAARTASRTSASSRRSATSSSRAVGAGAARDACRRPTARSTA